MKHKDMNLRKLLCEIITKNRHRKKNWLIHLLRNIRAKQLHELHEYHISLWNTIEWQRIINKLTQIYDQSLSCSVKGWDNQITKEDVCLHLFQTNEITFTEYLELTRSKIHEQRAYSIEEELNQFTEHEA